MGISAIFTYLATEGAKAEGVRETPAAYLAGVGDAFSRARLRAGVQEDNLGTVDNISLNKRDV